MKFKKNKLRRNWKRYASCDIANWIRMIEFWLLSFSKCVFNAAYLHIFSDQYGAHLVSLHAKLLLVEMMDKRMPHPTFLSLIGQDPADSVTLNWGNYRQKKTCFLVSIYLLMFNLNAATASCVFCMSLKVSTRRCNLSPFWCSPQSCTETNRSDGDACCSSPL